MSFQPNTGASELLKSFFKFGALQMVVWIVIGGLLWFASRWVPIWALALGIVLVLFAILMLGNPQNAQKREQMSANIKMSDDK